MHAMRQNVYLEIFQSLHWKVFKLNKISSDSDESMLHMIWEIELSIGAT